MRTTFSFVGIRSRARELWQRHSMAIMVLLALSVVAGLSNYMLRGSLLPSGIDTNPDVENRTTDDYRACSSVGTPFEDMTNLQEVIRFFRTGVSLVVAERETYLSTPSMWTCISGTPEPPMKALKGLAAILPGWQLNYTFPVAGKNQKFAVQKPVTFASFASVLAEFEREYECKLSEFQDQAFVMVSQGYDESTPAQYCCQPGCGIVTSLSSCDTVPSSDGLCGGTCGPGATMDGAEFMARLTNYHPLQLLERQHARIAMERTLLALRSYELNYNYGLQLTCLQRASLDLKNQMSLLADATSCMPRIWDAVTSIHDRKDE